MILFKVSRPCTCQATFPKGAGQCKDMEVKTERVSFGTNMSSEEETIESDSVMNKEYTSMTAIKRFLSHPVFKPKLNVYSMCAQELSLHTYRIENGYRITNVIIYNIFTK
jgi:hypothetical protein